MGYGYLRWVDHKKVGMAGIAFNNLAICEVPIDGVNLYKGGGRKIISPLYRMVLSTLGGNKDFSMVYRFAPARKQEISHVQTVLMHRAITPITGDLIRAVLEKTHLEIGISMPVLEANYGDFVPVVISVLKKLMGILHSSGVQLINQDLHY